MLNTTAGGAHAFQRNSSARIPPLQQRPACDRSTYSQYGLTSAWEERGASLDEAELALAQRARESAMW